MREVPNPNPLPGGGYEELPEGTHIWMHETPGACIQFQENPDKSVFVRLALPGALPWEEIPEGAGAGDLWLGFINGGLRIVTLNGRVTSIEVTLKDA